MATFGLNSGNNTWNVSPDYVNGMRFQNTAGDGTLTGLEILFDDATPNGNVRLGVYEDSSGSPGGLLLDAGAVAVADGWVSISGLNLSVTLDTYYWLAYNVDSDNGIRYQSGQPASSHHWRVYTYGTLPDPFGTGSSNNNQLVMRATVDTGGVTPQTSADSGAGVDAKSADNPQVAASAAESGSGVEVKADYPAGEITASETGQGSEAAVLLADVITAGDSGVGVESSSLDMSDYTAKFGGDTGNGIDTGVLIAAAINALEAGSGVEAVLGRSLILAESAIGSEFSIPVVVWTASDAGAGVEAATVIPVFFSGDVGLGSEFSLVLKDIWGGDGGLGADTLKALIGTMGASPDMKLHGRRGKTGMPSKGVNI